MKQHTEGEWYLVELADGFEIRSKVSEVIIADIAKTKTELNSEGFYEFADGEAEANARLIVNAPKMLEFLKRIADYLKEKYVNEAPMDVLLIESDIKAIIQEIEKSNADEN